MPTIKEDVRNQVLEFTEGEVFSKFDIFIHPYKVMAGYINRKYILKVLNDLVVEGIIEEADNIDDPSDNLKYFMKLGENVKDNNSGINPFNDDAHSYADKITGNIVKEVSLALKSQLEIIEDCIDDIVYHKLCEAYVNKINEMKDNLIPGKQLSEYSVEELIAELHSRTKKK